MAFRSSSVARQGLQSLLQKRADDVVLLPPLRTPIARMKKGFKDAYPEELLAFVLKRTRERLESRGVDKSIIEDICTGYRSHGAWRCQIWTYGCASCWYAHHFGLQDGQSSMC